VGMETSSQKGLNFSSSNADNLVHSILRLADSRLALRAARLCLDCKLLPCRVSLKFSAQTPHSKTEKKTSRYRMDHV
jgi:hypothetical protein